MFAHAANIAEGDETRLKSAILKAAKMKNSNKGNDGSESGNQPNAIQGEEPLLKGNFVKVKMPAGRLILYGDGPKFKSIKSQKKQG